LNTKVDLTICRATIFEKEKDNQNKKGKGSWPPPLPFSCTPPIYGSLGLFGLLFCGFRFCVFLFLPDTSTPTVLFLFGHFYHLLSIVSRCGFSFHFGT
jgi:hypothetical protein